MNEWMNAKANWIINREIFSLAIESDKHDAALTCIAFSIRMWNWCFTYLWFRCRHITPNSREKFHSNVTGSDEAYWPAFSAEVWQVHRLNLSEHKGRQVTNSFITHFQNWKKRLLTSSCLSGHSPVCLQGTIRLPMEGFSLNLVF
jgi:hypothetical protein